MTTDERMWVLDASMGFDGGLFCFCPIDGDIDGEFTVITGLNVLAPPEKAPSNLVAIVHTDGQAAVDAFCEEHAVALERLEYR